MRAAFRSVQRMLMYIINASSRTIQKFSLSINDDINQTARRKLLDRSPRKYCSRIEQNNDNIFIHAQSLLYMVHFPRKEWNFLILKLSLELDSICHLLID